MSPEYFSHLNSPKWERLRKQVIIRDKVCVRCGKPGSDCHHKTYARFGNENLEDVELLCRSCHNSHHELTKKNKSQVGLAREKLLAKLSTPNELCARKLFVELFPRIPLEELHRVLSVIVRRLTFAELAALNSLIQNEFVFDAK